MATVHQTYVLMLTQSTDSMLNAIQVYMYNMSIQLQKKTTVLYVGL